MNIDVDTENDIFGFADYGDGRWEMGDGVRKSKFSQITLFIEIHFPQVVIRNSNVNKCQFDA